EDRTDRNYSRRPRRLHRTASRAGFGRKVSQRFWTRSARERQRMNRAIPDKRSYRWSTRALLCAFSVAAATSALGADTVAPTPAAVPTAAVPTPQATPTAAVEPAAPVASSSNQL